LANQEEIRDCLIGCYLHDGVGKHLWLGERDREMCDVETRSEGIELNLLVCLGDVTDVISRKKM